MTQRLQAVIGPEQSILLEYVEQTATVSDAVLDVETNMYMRYSEKDAYWLVILAFADTKNALLPAMRFLQQFLFTSLANKVLRDPDCDEKLLRKRSFDAGDAIQALAGKPIFVGSEYCDEELLARLWKEAHQALIQKLVAVDGTLDTLLRELAPKAERPGRVYFHLVENKGQEAPFAFLSTYSTHDIATGQIKHVPLQHALQEFRDNDKLLLQLLSSVHKSAKNSHLIADLLRSGDIFYPLEFTPQEAYTFLQEATYYEHSGVLCRIPDWWSAATRKSTISVEIGSKKPAKVGLNAMLQACPSLHIDGVEITVEEARRLLEASEGLAFIKNKWVAVDPEKLKQTLEAYEKLAPLLRSGMSLSDAMRMQLRMRQSDDAMNDIVEFSSGDWLQQVLASMRTPAALDPIQPTHDFLATLRPYQQHGLNWLNGLYQLGFGGCLADDMGLGKTVQMLAFLGHVRDKTMPPSLLIMPASLLANWKQEIHRFLPDLNVFFAHPSLHMRGDARTLNEETARPYDLVMTTYAMIQRTEWIQSMQWNCVILDEAQAIKNPSTNQSKSIKKLHSTVRIALTGTPLENRLSDLWSLFDFLNPGLLGNAAQFKAYSKQLTDHPEQFGTLRQIISPFILRRKKTDKSIISDLPEKVELKTYSDLTKQQIVLYRAMLKELQEKLEDSEGIERRGLILSALMKTKQLCNHPAQYLGNGGYAEKESGKFLRLRELCETIYEKRERVLVFTQFKEMAEPLHDCLASIFEHSGRVLHGSVAVKKRQQIVTEFQNPDEYIPFMVLSIKAGGVGLNLTNANHVIHFDRWWNPAVENQATDRAFRIGQKKDVLVHKFITRGTIEERIDDMLEEKKSLFENVVESAETAMITEMSNEALMDLFTLRL
ncbi:MAG: DEAD/DEAH box helicase [Spartobacteria bacterium]|nr:DEAD/DEAH box helicase [Spartobacteria bacterium]